MSDPTAWIFDHEPTEDRIVACTHDPTLQYRVSLIGTQVTVETQINGQTTHIAVYPLPDWQALQVAVTDLRRGGS